jgi:hypothetical protein
MRRFSVLAVLFFIVVSLLGALPGVRGSQLGISAFNVPPGVLAAAPGGTPVPGNISGQPSDSSVLFSENARQAKAHDSSGGGHLSRESRTLTVVEPTSVAAPLLLGDAQTIPDTVLTDIWWLSQTVAATKPTGPSLALDAVGFPHISYVEAATHKLKYAAWTGTTWQVETVDSATSASSYTSLALDVAGRPHISYYDSINQDLRYAHVDAQGWVTTIVDSQGDAGEDSSLALDSQGHPHISYQGDQGIIPVLKYAHWDGSSWRITTVANESVIGWQTSLALDGAGRPHISYSDLRTGLHYAHWDGTNWQSQVVEAPGDSITDSSLALDGSGLPHISYREHHSGTLKYARRQGTSWIIEVIAQVSNDEWGNSLKLDSQGRPNVAFVDKRSDELRWAIRDAGGWQSEVVEHGSALNGASLTLAANGAPRISYGSAAGLRYARRLDQPITPTPTATATPTRTARPTRTATPTGTLTPGPAPTPVPEGYLTRLYLHSDGTLQETPQAQSDEFSLAPAWPSREWTYTLGGDIYADWYRFKVTLHCYWFFPYACRYAAELLLDEGATPTLLASASYFIYNYPPNALPITYTWLVTGIEPDAVRGEQLIFRIRDDGLAYGSLIVGGGVDGPRIDIAGGKPTLYWMDAQPLRLSPSGGKAVQVGFGNAEISSTLTGQLTGGAVFDNGTQAVSTVVTSTTGIYTFTLMPSAGSRAGDQFTLGAEIGGLTRERQGLIGGSTYLPLMVK